MLGTSQTAVKGALQRARAAGAAHQVRRRFGYAPPPGANRPARTVNKGKGDTVGFESMRVLDLSQDFSVHTPAFASYDGPSIKWVKRLAFDKAGGQEITTTLHVGTHLDAPAHFFSGGKFIGDLPLEWLVGTACVVDLERMGV